MAHKEIIMVKLNKLQQACLATLRGNKAWEAAFIAIIEANGKWWKRALREQFLHDSIVCGVDVKHMPYIRQSRNGCEEIHDLLYLGYARKAPKQRASNRFNRKAKQINQ